MPDLAITVVVCTRNRCAALDACLASLAAQVGDDRFDVVVVDNGSHDATGAVVARWRHRAPMPVRLVHELRTGLSHARNAGLAAVEAPIVAFLDDDARPAPGWLAAVLACYRHVPEAVAVGGPVTLTWPFGRPGWMSPGMESWYSAVDLGPTRRLLNAQEHLFGANFSVRRQAASAVGGFDPQLGRVGRRLRSGEEHDLLDRVRTFGSVVYEPGAGVEHEVLPDRLSRRWLLRRTYAGGRTRVALQSGDADGWRGHLHSARSCALEASMGITWIVRRVATAPRRGEALMEELVDRAVELGAARELLERGVRAALRSGLVGQQ